MSALKDEHPPTLQLKGTRIKNVNVCKLFRLLRGKVFTVCCIHLTKKQKNAMVYFLFVKNPTSTRFLSFGCEDACRRPVEASGCVNIRSRITLIVNQQRDGLKKSIVIYFHQTGFNQTNRIKDESCVFLLHVTHTHITVLTNNTDTLTTSHC